MLTHSRASSTTLGTGISITARTTTKNSARRALGQPGPRNAVTTQHAAVVTAIFQPPSGCLTSTRSLTPRWLPPCTTR